MFRVRSFAIAFAVSAALFSCAKKPLLQEDCTREAGLSRGSRDGRSARSPDLSFLQSCTDEARSSALAAYRESYEAARAKRGREAEAAEAPEAAQAIKPPTILPGREPANETWVCEVEANSKVFTGTGLSREEALGLARSTCSSHFTASYCTESSCRKNL